jgi:hypothetical protein
MGNEQHGTAVFPVAMPQQIDDLCLDGHIQ